MQDANFEDVLNFLEDDSFIQLGIDPSKDPLSEPVKDLTDPANVEEPDVEPESTEPESEEEFIEDTQEPEESADEPEEQTDLQKYYAFLKEQDFLKVSEDFDFDGSPESFEEALLQTEETMAKEAMNQLWTRLPQEFQKALAYGLNGGNSLKDFVREFVDDIDYSNFSIDSRESQRKVLEEYYRKTTKHDNHKIQRLVDKFDDDELYDEAQDALDYLRDAVEQEKQAKLDKLAQERLQQEERVRESNEQLAKLIQAEESLPPKTKTKLHDFIFSAKKEGGQVVTPFAQAMKSIQANPSHFIQFANLVMDYDPSKGFDLSRIEAKGKSKATSSFKKKLEETVTNTSKASGAPSAANGVSWEQLIKQLES